MGNFPRNATGNTAGAEIKLATIPLDGNLVDIQGAANKSNPLSRFVNISTTNLNFYKKIYMGISHSYLHTIAKLCCIITTFDCVMALEPRQPHVL